MTTELTPSRKERLHALEKDISAGIEEFYRTGMKLKEIRDDELYKEDGFTTWEDYCRKRWEWSRDYAYKLIRAAEYRDAIPDVDKKSTNKGKGWSESSVRELTRLENKRDAARVATKVVKAVKESEQNGTPIKLTTTLVRKFVDEEKGIDRVAQAKETKRKEQEKEQERERRREERNTAEQYAYDALWTITNLAKGFKEQIDKNGEQTWQRWRNENAFLVKRLLDGLDAFAEVLGGRKGLPTT